jgi:hypothetical protein
MNTNQAETPATSGGMQPPGDAHDLSIVLGGPLYQLLRRAHLADDALKLQRRRIIAISLVAWLPLLLLSAASGTLLDGSTAVPFLMDVEVHVKFLVVVPLLVAAELVVHQRMRTVAQTFRDRKLIPENAQARLDAAVASAHRLRNSLSAEMLLIALVYLVGVTVVWRHYAALDTSSWYATPRDHGIDLTFAGYWYAYVSMPLFQFLLIRWYFRMFIWARLLWHVSRIQLNLVPTHPDRVGGLGFLSNTVYAFIPLLMAHGALLAGQLASQIFYMGARLTDFRLEIVLLVTWAVFLIVGPMLVFSAQLAQAKRTGLREYGTLAQGYVRDFDAKWLRGRAPTGEQLLGSGDVQSLADLGSSFAVVQGMRIIPITKEAMLQLAAVTLAPMLPLVLTLMPLEELLKKLFGIVF